jgi:glucose uptake protein GlcU
MLKAALIMTGISIALLVIYALDVAVNEITGDSFLGSDPMARGIGLGMPALILPIISFFISRKEKSSMLGIMLIISGMLIIIGGIALFVLEPSQEAQESGRSIMERAAPLFVGGALIVALGAIKLKKS